jgi:hypothetical protein
MGNLRFGGGHVDVELAVRVGGDVAAGRQSRRS